jgi:hypothetical protein
MIDRLAPIVTDLRRLILHGLDVGIKPKYRLRETRTLRKSSSDKSDVGVHAYVYPTEIVSSSRDIVVDVRRWCVRRWQTHVDFEGDFEWKALRPKFGNPKPLGADPFAAPST